MHLSLACYNKLKSFKFLAEETSCQPIKMSSNVTHAEINETIAINCTEPSSKGLAMYYPNSICNASNQCTQIGICNIYPNNSCCVQPTSYCNGSAGQLSITVLMGSETFFGMWSCQNNNCSTPNCTTIDIQQFGKLTSKFKFKHSITNQLYCIFVITD